MAVATGTALAVGAGLAGVGGLMQARNQNKAAQQQTQSNAQSQAYLQGLMRQNPGMSEQAILQAIQAQQGPQGAGVNLQTPAPVGVDPIATGSYTPQMATQGFTPQQITAGVDPAQSSVNFDPQLFDSNFQAQQADVGGWLSGSGFNTGQDAIMQMLRADPRTKVDETLEGIMENQGNAFDTSGLFSALQAADAERQERALGDFQGSFTGLGQRFGSASQRGQADLQRGLANDAALRDAQIAMGAHEAAQGRLLATTGQLTGREQFGQDLRLRGGTQLQNAGLGATGLQLQGVQANNQANLAGEQLRLAAAQANNQALMDREGLNLQSTAQNNQANTAAAQLAAQVGQMNNQSGLAAAQFGADVVGQNNAAQLAAANLDFQTLATNQGAALQAAQGNQQVAVQMQQLAVQAQQGDQQAQMQLLALMQQAEQFRTGQNNQLALASQGYQPVAGPGYGGAFGDAGSAILLAGMAGGRQQAQPGLTPIQAIDPRVVNPYAGAGPNINTQMNLRRF